MKSKAGHAQSDTAPLLQFHDLVVAVDESPTLVQTGTLQLCVFSVLGRNVVVDLAEERVTRLSVQL